MYKYIYWFKRRIPQNYKPVILITGCTSGIGLALSELFYKQKNYRVVITGRDKKIQSLKDRFQEDRERFLILPLELTDVNSRKKIIEFVLSKWGSIDILINNAGISFRTVVEHMTPEDELLQMQTNYLGPMDLVRQVLPKMREKGRGKIINISSVSGMLAMPTMASYSASKHALDGASEALWYEARPFGIDVSLIQPGFIKSESFRNVYLSKAAKSEMLNGGPYSLFYKNMNPFIEKLMSYSRSSPQKIALLTLAVVQTERPPLWVPATFDAEFFYYLRRLFPRRLLLPFLYRLLPNVNSWGAGYIHKRDS